MEKETYTHFVASMFQVRSGWVCYYLLRVCLGLWAQLAFTHVPGNGRAPHIPRNRRGETPDWQISSLPVHWNWGAVSLRGRAGLRLERSSWHLSQRLLAQFFRLPSSPGPSGYRFGSDHFLPRSAILLNARRSSPPSSKGCSQSIPLRGAAINGCFCN